RPSRPFRPRGPRWSDHRCEPWVLEAAPGATTVSRGISVGMRDSTMNSKLGRKPEVAARDAGLECDVVSGLSRRPREIPPRWFYDRRGSELFEQITALEEYYPTRTEQ